MGRPSLKEEIIMKEREHKSLMARGWRCSSIGKMLDGMPETLGLIPSPAEAWYHSPAVLSLGRWRQEEDQEFKPRLEYKRPWVGGAGVGGEIEKLRARRLLQRKFQWLCGCFSGW